MKRIIIIGGGIAGLSAAYKIRRAAEAGHDVDFLLYEIDDKLGGQLSTEIVEDPDGRGRYIIDGGSDSFLTEKPAVHRIAKLLGIFDEETPTMDESKKTFIVKDGRLVEMPDGIMMFAPTKIMPMVTTKLYSWPAKFRMAFDLVLPKKRVAEGELNDETLQSFVVRRMGRETLDRLAEPLVGGVNGSDPATMSLAATYPMLLDMEQKHGSLVLGFLAQRKKVEEMKKKYPPKPGAKPRTFFSSFEPGLQYLTDRMADAAGRDRMHTGVAVTGVERVDAERGLGSSQPGERLADSPSGTWRVTLSNGETVEGDAVIVATEVSAAEPLVGGVDARIAELLGAVPSSSSATVTLAFDESDCPFDKSWHGILSPAVERRTITGVSLVSSKWPHRAPEGRVLLRGFIGGPRDPEAVTKGDDEIVDIAVAELTQLLGIREGARPVVARVFRWEKAMPQYTIGHLGRVDEIERRTGEITGFALAGGGYRGVGVPNCVESGEKAVSKVLGDWGIELAEDKQEEKRIY